MGYDVFYLYKTDLNGYTKESSIVEIEDNSVTRLKIAAPEGTDFTLAGNTYNYKYSDYTCLDEMAKLSDDSENKEYRVCFNALYKYKKSGRRIESIQLKLFYSQPGTFFQADRIYTVTIVEADIPVFMTSPKDYIMNRQKTLIYSALMVTKLIKTGNGKISLK